MKKLAHLILGIVIGYSGYEIQDHYIKGRRYTKDQIIIRESFACATGVVETLEYMTFKTRDKPANCDFSTR